MPTLSLRPFQQSDLPALVHHAHDDGIARFLTDVFPHPYTEADGQRFLDRVTTEQPPRVLALIVDEAPSPGVPDGPIGAIGVFPQADVFCLSAELGYWVGRRHWGRGLATQAVRQAVDYAFAHWPIARVFARPFGSNHASQRVLEKAGFVLEARFTGTILKRGTVEDELVYAVRRSTWRAAK